MTQALQALQSIETENLAQTLARELPKPQVIETGDGRIIHVATPKGYQLTAIDQEPLLDNPRRTVAAVKLDDCDSFLAYIAKYSQPRTVVWCEFNPQAFMLRFCAVIDEHSPDAAGWRSHSAVYHPTMSAEWATWTRDNKQAKEQTEFAEYIERHEPDIAQQEGYPTSLQMLAMATEFEANSEKKFKSIARLHGGGLRLEYVDDNDAATLTQMKFFEKFQIGIPVFWAGPGYRIDARLKYRQNAAKVKFWYELIRPDRVHEAAAKELIELVRVGIKTLPLLMGTAK